MSTKQVKMSGDTPHILLEYVRDARRNKIGVIVALDSKHIGWSVCSPKDRFSKERGVNIASARAISGTNVKPLVSKGIPKLLRKMENRAEKYFWKDNFSPVQTSSCHEIK
jgi:hypothetical protein